MVTWLKQSFNTARSFMDALRLSNSEWWSYHSVSKEPDRDWQRDWIFRGERSIRVSDEWQPLVPSAWRSKAHKANSPLVIIKDQIRENLGYQEAILNKLGNRQFYEFGVERISDIARQQKLDRIEKAVLNAFAEITLVNEFIRLADELGFRVERLVDWSRRFSFVHEYIDLSFPDDQRQKWRIAHERNGTRPPLVEEQSDFWSKESIALAQHHGVSTRLLDWTRNPLYAAYFAASGVVPSDADDCIAVYAIHRNMLGTYLREVETPSSDNDFLRAQSGIFTIDLNADEFFVRNGRYPSLEESTGYISHSVPEYEYPKRLTLIASEAPELLRLLWLERITEAHLMPTLDHVASAVIQKMQLNSVADARYLGTS